MNRPLPPGAAVVVLGGGISGLAVAALLARAGHPVTVLEQHPTALGGLARSIALPGCTVCAGPQFVWGFGPGQLGDRFLGYLGLADRVGVESLGPKHFERVLVGDDFHIDIPVGLDLVRARMVERFADERVGLDRFFDALDDLAPIALGFEARGVYLHGRMARALDAALASDVAVGQKWRGAALHRMTLGELFDRCGLSPLVRRVLYGHGGVFAESEDEVSLAIYATFMALRHAGTGRLVDGVDSLVKGLRDVIESHGGEVLLGRPVTALVRDGRTVTAARCADGSEHRAALFVSTLAPRQTRALLAPAPRDRYRYQPSHSLNMSYLAVRPGPWTAGLQPRNSWWQRMNGPVRFADPCIDAPAMLYIGGLTARSCEGGAHPLVVFSPGSHPQALDHHRRGPEAYAAYRHRVERGVLHRLDALFPGLVDEVVHLELHTPLEVERATRTEQGAIYGRRLTPASILTPVPRLRAATNLAMADTTTGLPGIATCLRTASLLVAEVTGAPPL